MNNLTKKNCELVGIVGRKAFHIFDKTHRTWICSSRALGYDKIFGGDQDDWFN